MRPRKQVVTIHHSSMTIHCWLWSGRTCIILIAVFPWAALFWSSSCALYEAFSTALEWLALYRLGASGVLHILDDFLFIAENEEKCQADLNSFLKLFEYLGVPMAEEKPSVLIPFYNSRALPLIRWSRKPNCQTTSFKNVARYYMLFISVAKWRLRNCRLSLLGLLNLTCSVVVPGRAFLRRMIDLSKGAKRRHHHICLTKEVKHDIVVWLTFLAEFKVGACLLSISNNWSPSRKMSVTGCSNFMKMTTIQLF